MDLKSLGSNKTDYVTDKISPELLERFQNPDPSRTVALTIVQPEFTSLCPVTGQPDFAKIFIQYTPDAWCVESKSLKLYLGSFRNVGDFHESCVIQIHDHLVSLLDPQTMFVQGQFTPRGGIPFWPHKGQPLTPIAVPA
jgi:7-cyano-7-deazaguanine reductase